jgi:hypothetical protein
MATTEGRRRRSVDRSHSGRAVILVQIISWCAAGALLILRGVTTLTNGDSVSSSTENRTAPEILTNRTVNGTSSSSSSSRATYHNEGNLILRAFRVLRAWCSAPTMF